MLHPSIRRRVLRTGMAVAATLRLPAVRAQQEIVLRIGAGQPTQAWILILVTAAAVWFWPPLPTWLPAQL